jgi:uncharacterized protein
LLVLGIIDFMKRACKISFKWPLVVGTALALVWGQATSASAADELTLDTAQAKAAKSDAPAEYFLGKLYERGKGVTQDYAKAADYLRQAADQGYAPAQTDLGALYAQGLGVKLDDQQAAAWYRKAADNGDPLAQYAMGLFYSEARGVPGDPQESLKWYQEAAAHNQPDALLALGDIYANGRNGMAINVREAVDWLEKARAQGSYDADNSLGSIYQYGGDGINPDRKKAFDYYHEAALKGNGRAEMNLGRLYLDGSGVKVDLVEAYQWFYLATRNGEMLARHYLRELDGTMPNLASPLTADQKAEAIRQANELQKTIRKDNSKVAIKE